MLLSIGKGVIGFIILVLTYYLCSAIAYLLIIVIRNDGSGWGLYVGEVVAVVISSSIGVVAGAALLTKILRAYPARTIGVAFIILQIVLVGFGIAVEIWMPSGELFTNLILPGLRSVVAIVLAFQVFLIGRGEVDDL